MGNFRWEGDRICRACWQMVAHPKSDAERWGMACHCAYPTVGAWYLAPWENRFLPVDPALGLRLTIAVARPSKVDSYSFTDSPISSPMLETALLGRRPIRWGGWQAYVYASAGDFRIDSALALFGLASRFLLFVSRYHPARDLFDERARRSGALRPRRPSLE